MAKLARMIEIDGQAVNVPPYVNRTASGWQVRVRNVESQHFADAHYGGAIQSLAAASLQVRGMLLTRTTKEKTGII